MNLTFIALQFVFVLLPGYVLACLFNMRQHVYFVSLVFSYFYFIVIVTLGRELGWTPEFFAWVYIASIVALLLLMLFVSKPILPELTNRWLPGLLAVLLGYVGYFLWAGNYTEVPADLYQHLTYAQREFRFWNSGNLGKAMPLSDLLQQKGEYWYALLVALTYFTNNLLIDTFESAMFTNNVLFLCGVYFFALTIFKSFDFTKEQRQLAAVLATFFVFAQMGINVFSFVRYYALAPVMLNFIVYFAGIIACVGLLNNEQKVKHSFILLVSLIVAAMVHTQEALFIGVMFILMLCVLLIQATNRKHWPNFYRWYLPGFGLAVIASVSMFVIWLAANHLPRSPQPAYLITRIVEQVPLFGHLMVLNPEHQLIKVITIWGAWIYILFFVLFRNFKGQPYIIAGMLSPVFTVLNPFFVDLFLRFDSATTVWRLLYLAPMHFVAAASIVILFQLMKKAKLLPKLVSVIAVFLSVLLLFPGVLGVTLNTFAKETLLPVKAANDYRQWRDIFDELNRVREPKKIITDPLTGYLVRALTHHHTYGYKFYERQDWGKKFALLQGENAHIEVHDIKDWVLINKREGGLSAIGAKAMHWSPNVLRFSHYYDGLNPESIGRFQGKLGFSEWMLLGLDKYQVNN